MKSRIIDLLMNSPFEKIMEIVAAEDITVHYDAHEGSYYCKYSRMVQGKNSVVTETTTPAFKKANLAVAHAIVSKLRNDDE